MEPYIQRGEVYLVELNPTKGSEIQKTRPCIIVSPDELHNQLNTVIVVPMTTGSRPAKFRLEINFKGKSGFILPEQVRAVDKSRLVGKIGSVDDFTLHKLLNILQEMFSI